MFFVRVHIIAGAVNLNKTRDKIKTMAASAAPFQIAKRIAVGDAVPLAPVFKTMVGGEPRDLTAEALFAGAARRVLLVAIPGAFTPTCHLKHLPKFIQHADAIRSQHRLDALAFTAVNDVFVMNAWAAATGADKAGIMMLADGAGQWAASVGMLKDTGAAGLGWRSQRYAMLVEGGKVQYVGVDEVRGSMEHSGAEYFLSKL